MQASNNVRLMSCVAECSDGGNSHMGAAHSDPSQGKCLQRFSPFFSFVSVPSPPVSGTFKDARCRECWRIFPPCSSVHTSLFSLCTERASCSSRMCSSETIVKEPRWQETRLRKTKICIHFLTTSFHFLPVGSILFFFLTQLQGKRCMIVSLHVLFVLCHMFFFYARL